LRIVHPFPTIMNALTVGGLGLIALGRRQPNAAILLLMLAMLAIQATIGTVNDLNDRDLDAASKPYKPLVAGDLSAGAARALALLFLLLAVVLSAGFGLAAWLLAMLGLVCGLAYDLGLKRSSISVLPYLIALPLLPLWVWVALGRFRPLLLALIPLGWLIGLSLHLANGLTDFAGDAQGGSLGLVQRLGERRSIALCWGSFALALLLIAGSAVLVRYRPVPLLAGLAPATLLLLATLMLYRLRPVQSSLQIGWTLLVAGSAALALGWLAALPL
jgi:4-hydroxybenzoate polyprenyltransferase